MTRTPWRTTHRSPGPEHVWDPGSCVAYAAYAGFSSRRGNSTAPFVTVAPAGS